MVSEMVWDSEEETFPPPPPVSPVVLLTTKTPGQKRRAPPPPPPRAPPPQHRQTESPPPSPLSLPSTSPRQSPTHSFSELCSSPTLVSAPLYPAQNLVIISRDIEISQYSSPSQTISDPEEFPPLPNLPEKPSFWSSTLNWTNIREGLEYKIDCMEWSSLRNQTYCTIKNIYHVWLSELQNCRNQNVLSSLV